MTKSPKDMSDQELVASLKSLVAEQRRATAQALADVYAGKAVDPFALDGLRDYLDDEEVDELEAINDARLEKLRAVVRAR